MLPRTMGPGSFVTLLGNTPPSSFTNELKDADWVVTKFSRSEPLEEALTVSVTCRPTLVNRPPEWR